jgi:hypothetical protein
MAKHHNRPGGPTNPPQHSAGEERRRPQARNKHAKPGRGGSFEAVADPHPSTEEHYDLIRHPGGANPPKKDLSTAVSRHEGVARPPPRNADND